ncbi:MAG: M1 family metallopeptidase [Acidobacteria bacterium]|jgi:aminopeptidase N|nr:M1 family metallopeptidase [Acidobacteriota bacterium]
MMKKLFPKILVCILLFATTVFAQRDLGARPTGSGGVLMPEQAAYDVKSYDLAVRVNPQEQSIKGVLTAKALIVKPIDKFVLDLDMPFTVESVALVSPLKDKGDIPLKFERREGKIWISLPTMEKAGKTIDVRMAYGGKPRVAPRPPWVGGFVWSKTADGSPWFATAVQNDGADLWFPVKDHPSDKPETTTLHFTVPEPLVAASNGKLQSVVKNADGTRTYNWFVSQPISNYCIALNVAPYKLVEDKVKSVSGEMIPIQFYVLPEHFEKAQSLIDLTKKYNAFFEEYLGPYPFRADKIGIAETPHLGMEHQSITAYGNEFKYNEDGDDWLIFHEFGHEWWANLVTGKDWNDFWIHEGFESFMDTFYIEKTKGKEAYFKAMAARQKNFKNVKPVAPREPRTTTEMYMLPPDYTKSDGDIYGKGAMILNTLRFYLGDEAFFKSLRRMAYPTPEMEKITNGKQTRLVTTDEFLKIAEQQSGKKLDWFFELYLRQPALPKLVSEAKGNQLTLRWETPNNLSFPMPVEISIGGKSRRVEMTNGKATVQLPQDVKYEIDPNGWLLKAL